MTFHRLVTTALCGFAFLISSVTIHADDTEAVKDLLENLLGVEPTLVQPSALDSFYIASFDDMSVMYVSKDLRWVFQGSLTEISQDNGLKLISHTDNFKNQSRKVILDSLDPSEMISFAPPFEAPRAVVHVFTDTTCGYCQKLHAEMNDYHAKGIEIRYLAYPRAGVGSEPYDEMVSAWCADNPQTAITQLKLGQPIEEETCRNPISEQYMLGQQMGLRGTPYMVLSNGKTVGGYVNAAELEEILDDEGLL